MAGERQAIRGRGLPGVRVDGDPSERRVPVGVAECLPCLRLFADAGIRGNLTIIDDEVVNIIRAEGARVVLR